MQPCPLRIAWSVGRLENGDFNLLSAKLALERTGGMRPLAGLFFRGATLTEHDELAPGAGALGRPVWGVQALLANLELRLGLPTPAAVHGLRLQRWSQRLAEGARSSERFYSGSYSVDPIGTAGTLLAWRDLLVDAGWNGQAIPGGGPRLEAFVELADQEGMPPGTADRLRLVEAELLACGVRPWQALELAEPLAAWSGRWQRVFQLLEERGTAVRSVAPSLESADAATDLGRLQASLRGGSPKRGLQGDGSLLVLGGETSWELAHAVAAGLRSWQQGSAVVVRGGDPRALVAAMAAQGLVSQGVDSESAWRPALQILPLALELAYSPRDPYRVLELVTLPLGPFSGWIGRRLARALAASPGMGGRDWQAAKRAIAERLEAGVPEQAKERSEPQADATGSEARDRLQQIAEWLEEPGHDPLAGAPRLALLEVSARVANWLKRRALRATLALQRGEASGCHDLAVLRAALAQAQAFQEALGHDARAHLELVAVRQLLQEVSLGAVALPWASEHAGRIDLVESPAGLRCSRDLVVWWHCVQGTQAMAPVDPWRRQERQALEAAGVHLPDPSLALAAEVAAWRGVVLSARQRLVLVVPSTAQGARLDAHPIWDELSARLDAGPADVARVSLNVEELLRGSRQLPQVACEKLPSLSLPEARLSWQLAPALLGGPASYSATSLEDFLGCPLRWVFRNRAGLNDTWAAAIPNGPLLNGRLGHRLIEELHLAGALASVAEATDAVGPVLERLLLEEAAVLLRPGMTFELSQLREQLRAGVVRLSELLAQSKLAISDVETAFSVAWGGRELKGRLDLLLADSEGREVVVDLKWGRSSYHAKLQHGLALQLAVYAGARQIQRGASALPAAGYFALGRGELLTTDLGPFKGAYGVDGPKLAETWSKLERSVPVVEGLLARGLVPAPGVRGAPPLLASAGISEPERTRYLEPEPPCEYCEHSALCGRAWERLA